MKSPCICGHLHGVHALHLDPSLDKEPLVFRCTHCHDCKEYSPDPAYDVITVTRAMWDDLQARLERLEA